jgi:hypothetical protein
MSMPSPLNVVVLASLEAGFHGIEKVSGLTKPGVSPRYLLATVEESDKFADFSSIDTASIGFWVALDHVSKIKCEDVAAKLQLDPEYSRGFYDSHLPNPVASASNMVELQRIVDEIWEAFCATS